MQATVASRWDTDRALTRAHFWDVSSVAALDAVVLDYRRVGADVEVVGMNEASAAFVAAHAEHDKPVR